MNDLSGTRTLDSLLYTSNASPLSIRRYVKEHEAMKIFL